MEDLTDTFGGPDAYQSVLPGLGTILARVGAYSLNIFTGAIVLLSIWAMTTYIVVSPHTVLRGYLRLFPAALQSQAVKAWERSAGMVTGWLWSNVVVGAVEAVAVALVLPLLGVPNALLWAALAFFAELVPKIGGYIMSVPPILVAFGESATTGLMTAAFFVVLLQLTANVIDPPIRGNTMSIHPAVLLFAVLGMAAGFGFIGALIATPVAGITLAFIEAFLIPRQGKRELDADVNRMLHAR